MYINLDKNGAEYVADDSNGVRHFIKNIHINTTDTSNGIESIFYADNKEISKKQASFFKRLFRYELIKKINDRIDDYKKYIHSLKKENIYMGIKIKHWQKQIKELENENT